MKKIRVAFFALFVGLVVVGCQSTGSHFSVSASYMYGLISIVDKDGVEISVPNTTIAKRSIDSVLLAFTQSEDLGGIMQFGVVASTPAEAEVMMANKLKVLFDSMLVKVNQVDFQQLLNSTSASKFGGRLQVAYQITTPMGGIVVVRDTVADLRVNFVPALSTVWQVDEPSAGKVTDYTFGAQNSVLIGVDNQDKLSSTYTIDPINGVMSVRASGSIATHQLTFGNQANTPALTSSLWPGEHYFLR